MVLDVVAPEEPVSSPAHLEQLGTWLVRHQPISLAINGISTDADHATATAAAAAATDAAAAAAAVAPLQHLAVARTLFERSALCVYSVGDASCPALTAQARPQDGEIFGTPTRPQLSPGTRTTRTLPRHTDTCGVRGASGVFMAWLAAAS